VPSASESQGPPPDPPSRGAQIPMEPETSTTKMTRPPKAASHDPPAAQNPASQSSSVRQPPQLPSVRQAPSRHSASSAHATQSPRSQIGVPSAHSPLVAQSRPVQLPAMQYGRSLVQCAVSLHSTQRAST